nr:HNH endonuclease domain-containing protein [uncultured Anaerostipes sp.]
MVEYSDLQGQNILEIEPKYHNKLNIEGFSKMMKDPSFCYKFYWLEAIVQLISEGKTETTFDEIIDEMIANAWYSVREFHIHLSGMPMDGQIKDGLERAILQLTELSDLPANASKVQIKNAIQKYNKELKEVKEQLTHMVPYRALAGFFTLSDEKINWNSTKWLVAYIQKFNKTVVSLPYLLGTSSKLKKEVYFQQGWIRMIQDHTVNIWGWIQYEKVKWLQNNNPEVPGLVYKLTPMDEKTRKLKNVRNLWQGIMEIQEIRDVFTGQPVKKKKYDIDHFIPWSFVMNDELWNLMPMDSSLNSSKSNRLPKWNPFFKSFAGNQYLMYRMIYENAEIYDRFKRCYKDNLHSIWAGQELYRKGNSKETFYNILEKNMMPVYDSARRQGYEIWIK